MSSEVSDPQAKAGRREAAITKLDAFWLRLPLLTSYENALGPISDFDVILMRVEDEEGGVGWGEACPVKGYSPESPGEAWELSATILPTFKGMGPQAIEHELQRWHSRYPFLVSGIVESLEDLSDEPLLRSSEPVELELAGTVNTLNETEAAAYASRLVDQGYRSLKVKVGYDPMGDARRVNTILAAVGDQARLRVDANQGYGADAALVFAGAVDAAGVEMFEQPVSGHDWDAMGHVAAHSVIPVMLDEAIYGDVEIVRASKLSGVAAVKLKLSKSGGARELYRQFRLATECGLQVVVGNGVASDLGCLHEALACSHAHMPLAGEMNGFIKTEVRLLDPSPTISGAHLIIQPSSGQCVNGNFDNWIYKMINVA